MFSFWQQNLLGKYNPTDNFLGVDYKKLSNNPHIAQSVVTHEISHNILFATTEFGIATTQVCQAINNKYISEKSRNAILQEMKKIQYHTQETSATLMGVLYLRKVFGKNSALNWARQNLPETYYKLLSEVEFIFGMSKKYREHFTAKIPHLALHTTFRKDCPTGDLLSNKKLLSDYLKVENNNPDARWGKLVKAVRTKPRILNKDVKDICNFAEVEIKDTNPKEVAEFINYLNKISGRKEIKKVTHRDITPAKTGISAARKSYNNLVLANINMDLVNSSEFIFDENDLLHYAEYADTLMISKTEEDNDYKALLEQATGIKLEVNLFIRLKDGQKILHSTSCTRLEKLLENEFKKATRVVKWGMYDVDEQSIRLLKGAITPDVVIYNNLNFLNETLKGVFNSRDFKYIYLEASQNHPFKTLVLLEDKEIIHWVNVFGNIPVEKFLKRHSNFLKIDKTTKTHLKVGKNFNSAMGLWNNMNLEIDWYRNIMETV